jgi:hypothetical protein
MEQLTDIMTHNGKINACERTGWLKKEKIFIGIDLVMDKVNGWYPTIATLGK